MTMSIGEQLREAREQQSLSLEDAAHTTHIRTHYLEALEADDLTIFPSMAQVRGFLRAYARYLHLDPESLLSELEGGEVVAEVLLAPQRGIQQPAKEGKDPLMEQVDEIFVEVGQKLREHREVLGLSMQDIERQTHIRVDYIRALEEGDLGGLPSPVQGRGMLNNYASFLGLDPDPLLLRYADGLQALLDVKRVGGKEQSAPYSEQVARRPSALRRLFSTDLIAVGLLVIFLISFIIWGTLRISAMRAGNEPSLTAPSIAEVLLDTSSEMLTSTPAEFVAIDTPAVSSGIGMSTPEAEIPAQDQVGAITQTITATITLPAVSEGTLQVSLITMQRAWMRVTVDGEVLFEGRIQPGGAYSYAGDERIEVLTGNGAALRVYFNQQDLGILGIFGEVIMRVFTIEGVQTPTATTTPIGIPLPTSTPSPAVTPASTPTIEP